MQDTTVQCKLCESDVGSTDPEAFPYCRDCYITGAAFDDAYAPGIAELKAALLVEAEVSAEHTGGHCWWLAVRIAGDPKFYVLTDGDASLPTADDGVAPVVVGGWGYVGRHDDTESDENPDYDGTILHHMEPPGRWTTAEVASSINADLVRRGVAAAPTEIDRIPAA